MNREYDAIIVGAGMSGLGAGIRLALFGKRVCILEKHYLWGGLNSFYRKDGRRFDVGLHAMTNYVSPEKLSQGPLRKIYRQLRIRPEEFQLREQLYSQIHFPSCRLTFSNDPDRLESEIHENFPKQIDGYRALVRRVMSHDDGDLFQEPKRARSVMAEHISSPLLIDMILCPLLFYGSATEHDMDWNQFVIMFKSIFIEGFCRPIGGVRTILNVLTKKFKEAGGELRLKSEVRSIVSKGSLAEVALSSGEKIRAKSVLSSAGYVETERLLGKHSEARAGRLSFVESIFCLKRAPKELDIQSSIVFYSKTDSLHYREPSSLVDTGSGVICVPNNFEGMSELEPSMVRVTNIANYDHWVQVNERGQDNYRKEKQRYVADQINAVGGIIPPFERDIEYVDSFTPLTIKRFTSHDRGAVYGSGVKKLDGQIGDPNVYLCGTDQGYLGIVGALLSGVLMANRYALRG